MCLRPCTQDARCGRSARGCRHASPPCYVPVARSSTATCAAGPARCGSDGKEHRPAAGQHLGPEVIELAARLRGPRQHGDVATVGRHALQAGRRIRRGKDDRVIRRPGRSELQDRYCDCRSRPTGDGHLLERAALHEPDPLAIGRDEDPSSEGTLAVTIGPFEPSSGRTKSCCRCCRCRRRACRRA